MYSFEIMGERMQSGHKTPNQEYTSDCCKCSINALPNRQSHKMQILGVPQIYERLVIFTIHDEITIKSPIKLQLAKENMDTLNSMT